jgi:hypothetical protein
VSRAHSSALVRFLRNPSREVTHALATLWHALQHLPPFTVLVAVVCVIVAFAARALLIHARERRLARGARLLELAVPPELEPEGALLLWSSLHDLLRPRLARLLNGQPQLAWEIAADARGSRFRLWIPVMVPPGLVERTLASAWPGITITAASRADHDRATDAPDEEAV